MFLKCNFCSLSLGVGLLLQLMESVIMERLNTFEISSQNNEFNTTSAVSYNEKSEPISLKCPLGHEAKIEEENFSCTKCQLGHFRNSTMEKCSLCPAGYETLIEGMKDCTPCFYGKFKNDGELKCHDCPKGTISLLKGASECKRCPPIFYCPCSVCHPVTCSSRGFCPEGSESPLFCKFPLMKRVGLNSNDCILTSELIGLICGGVLLLTLLSSVILANIFLKPRADVVRISASDTGSTRYLLQDASSTSEPHYSGL